MYALFARASAAVLASARAYKRMMVERHRLQERKTQLHREDMAGSEDGEGQRSGSDLLFLVCYLQAQRRICLPMPRSADSDNTPPELMLEFTQRPPTSLESHGTGDTSGVLWGSSVVLAEHILSPTGWASVQAATSNHDRPVAVELGCGATALPSVALAAAGGCGFRRILATDIPEVCDHTRQNMLTCGYTSYSAAAKVDVEALPWGAEALPSVEAAGEGVGLILCSDVLYDRQLLPQLLSALSALADPQTHVLLAFQNRSDVLEADILEKLLPQLGFGSQAVALPSATATAAGGNALLNAEQRSYIRLYRVWRESRHTPRR